MITTFLTHARSLYTRLQEMALFLPLLLLSFGVWAFIQIADEVFEGDTEHFDKWALRTMRKPNDLATPIGPGWMQEMGRDLTALGGVIVLVLVILGVAGYLWLRKKHHAMWLTLGASFGGMILAGILKRSFERPRPDIVPHLSIVATTSFPSGHSMLSATVYLTLGLLLARTATDRATRFYPIIVAVVLTFLVGLSRVYMGVHYPTDVMAGWTAGGVWAVFCWMIAKYLQHRGQIEEPDEEQAPPPANPS